MATRFTDDIKNNIEESDFIVRKWKWGSIQLFVLFAITFVTIYLTASIMYDLGDRAFFFATLTCVYGILCWFMITLAARNRDLVMATEFQNTLLASSTQLGTRFCFITKRDGAIVYIDPGFQKLFQSFMHSGNATVDGLFTYAGIGHDVKNKVFQILQQYTNDRMQLAFKSPEGTALPMMVTIDVLARPKGYFLFRGRDFVEKRNGSAEGVPVATDTDITSAMLLSQALYSLPEGILVTDKNGIITYVNHTLEEWLGYSAGEMQGIALTLKTLCHRYGDKEAGVIVFDNYEGEITLLRKDGTTVILTIRQILVRHEGNPIGISAIIKSGS